VLEKHLYFGSVFPLLLIFSRVDQEFFIVFSTFKYFSIPQSIKITTASKIAHKVTFLENAGYNAALKGTFSSIVEIFFH